MPATNISIQRSLLQYLNTDLLRIASAETHKKFKKAGFNAGPSAYVMIGLEGCPNVALIDLVPVRLTSPTAHVSASAAIVEEDEEHLDELASHLVACLVPGYTIIGVIAAPPTSATSASSEANGKRVDLKVALLVNQLLRSLQVEVDQTSGSGQALLLLQASHQVNTEEALSSSSSPTIVFGNEGFVLRSLTSEPKVSLSKSPVAVPIHVTVTEEKSAPAIAVAKFLCPSGAFVPSYASDLSSSWGIWTVEAESSKEPKNICLGLGQSECIELTASDMLPNEISTVIQPIQLSPPTDGGIFIPMIFSSKGKSNSISVKASTIAEIISRCATQFASASGEQPTQHGKILVTGLAKKTLFWNSLGALAEDDGQVSADADPTIDALVSDFVVTNDPHNDSTIHFFGPKSSDCSSSGKPHASQPNGATSNSCCRPLFTEKPFSGTVFTIISAVLVLMTAVGAGLILTSPKY